MKFLLRYSYILVVASLCLSTSGHAQCDASKQATFLHANSTRTPFYPSGYFFHENQNAGYIPNYYGSEFLDVASIFAGGLWVGGIDANEQTKVSVATYGWANNRADFNPGPIDPRTGLAWHEEGYCETFNRVWKVRRHEIEALLEDIEDNGEIDHPIATSIKGWPSVGNPYFEEIWGVPLPDFQLAPFFDKNGDARYDPVEGDYPIIGNDLWEAMPDELLWAVFNDQIEHTESNSEPLNIEVQLSAWAFDCSDFDIANQSIFTRHKIIYYGNEPLKDVRIGLWTDPDIGCYTDDYAGCNPSLNTAYFYNADAIDGESGFNCQFGINTFGEVLPVQALTLLNEPMESFNYMANPGIASPLPATTDPNTVEEYYHFLDGRWRDGSPITVGGNGYNSSTETTKFIFPDNPNDVSGWSQTSVNFSQNTDFRTLSTTHIDEILPGRVINLDAAYSFHRVDQASHLEAVNLMEEQIPLLQAFYDGGFQTTCTQSASCIDSDCVWPGDANNDGIANHKDVLSLGIGVGNAAQGQRRNSINNSWRPNIVANWGDNLVDGTDFKHLDCDGNGRLLAGDQNAIEQNYDQQITGYIEQLEPPTQDGILEFKMMSSKRVIDYNGTPGERFLPVQVALNSNDTELYGVAFTLSFNPEWMNKNGLFVASITNSNFIVPITQNNGLKLKQGSAASGKLDVVICRSDLQNIAGESTLAILNIEMGNDFMTPNEDGTLEIPFTISDVRAINAREERLSVQANTLNFLVENVPVDSTLVSVKELGQEDWNLSISPNPTNGELLIESAKPIERITLLDAQGKQQTVLKVANSQRRQYIELPPLPVGLYFLNCSDKEGHSITRKIVIEQ